MVKSLCFSAACGPLQTSPEPAEPQLCRLNLAEVDLAKSMSAVSHWNCVQYSVQTAGVGGGVGVAHEKQSKAEQSSAKQQQNNTKQTKTKQKQSNAPETKAMCLDKRYIWICSPCRSVFRRCIWIDDVFGKTMYLDRRVYLELQYSRILFVIIM